MSSAWETTVEDVQNVLKKMGKTCTEEQADQIHSSLDHQEIERSALQGNDMETQTEYAYEEINRQITCLDVWKELGK